MATPRPQTQARAGSDAITIADRRRVPFLWISLEAVAHLRGSIPDARELMVARSLYLAMAELAARALDGQHDGFSCARAELAAFAGISDRRLGPHLDRLRAIGLVDVLEQRDGRGASLPNLYRLVDVPTPAPAPTEQGGATASPLPPGATASPPRRQSAPASPPTRTRADRGKEEEEREREGGAHAPPVGPVTTEPEAAALAELAELALERGARTAAAVQDVAPAILEAMRAHPDVDPLEAARRLRAHYGPGGKAERRPIQSYAGLMRTELDRSTAFQPAAKGKRGRGSTRAMTGIGLAERATAVPGIAPGPELVIGWEAVRENLKENASESLWALYIEPLRLLGERTDRRARTIVLEAPAGAIGYVRSSSLKPITAWAEQTLGPVAVELVPEGSRIVAEAA